MGTPRRVAAGALALLLGACSSVAPHLANADTNGRAEPGSGPPQVVRLPDPSAAVGALDLDRVRSGDQAVPRATLTDLPSRLTEIERVERRKRLFLKTLLPAALQANENVRAQRQFVTAVARLDLPRTRLPASMRDRLARLEETYRVDAGDLDALLRKVDTIPVSLLLAQAAIESGWGTSRFAQHGNALFGEHTRDPDHTGMKPRRLGDPDFRVRTFATLDAAVAAYQRNLNSHPAYAGLRAIRAAARAEGRVADGAELAAGLQDYSARGQTYVNDLRVTIDANDLEQLRNARLEPAVQTIASLVPGRGADQALR